MTLAVTTVTNSIAALSINAVVNGSSVPLAIKDMDEVPAALSKRGLPLLLPHPDLSKFLTDFTLTDQSTGAASSRATDLTYTLNYLLIYQPVGATRNVILDHYSGMVQTIFAIAEGIRNTDILQGAVTADVGTPGEFVEMEDGGVSYFTCVIPVHVLEFIN